MPITPEQNNLSLLNYRLKVDAIPHIEYRVQTLSLPGITLGTADVQTPFTRIPFGGNVVYDELTLTFMVGEQMKDYLSIYDWIKRIGYPENLNQYNYSATDGSVIILDSSFKAAFNARFTEMIPISLSSIEFDSTLSDVQYATSTVSFRFTSFTIEAL